MKINSNNLHKILFEGDRVKEIVRQKLIIETQIAERALIIYVIESDLKDNQYPRQYKLALKDEVKNHKTVIKEYKKLLKKLS